jgi:WD40 repeat protein/nucleoside phosphorylase
MALAQQHFYSQPQHKADVLLVTVTEVEANAVLKLFPDYKRRLIGPDAKTYYDLGIISDTRVFMVQSVEMGVSGPGGALLTVLEALLALTPSTIIMVGIAFGAKPAEQKTGDILVSTQICDYNQQRVGTDAGGQTNIRLRGSRIPAPTRLLDKFRAGAKDWPCPANIHFGPILSGEKLVDNLDYRNQLLQLEPDAIGGEMEGAALGTVEQRRKVDWILVKAICDWADGNKSEEKDERQKEAADNAAEFTLHVIRQGGFRGYSGTSGAMSPPPSQGSLLCSYNIHAHWVLALSWGPDGQRIASTGGAGDVHVWDAETAQPLVTYRGHQHRGIMAKTPFLPTIYNVVWSPVEPRIASCGDGREVHVWDAETGGTICVYRGHSGLLPNVFAIDWSPDGQYIASACSSAGIDKTIHIWDVRTGQTIRRCATHAGANPNFSVLALAWSPDGSRIAATCGNHTILLLNPYTGERINSYHVSAPWTSDISWSPDGRFLAAANSDGTIQVWDTYSHQVVLTYSAHHDSVRAVAWSPDGTRIASASNDKTVWLWSFTGGTGGTHLFTYPGHRDWTTSVAWSPDGTRVASGSNDKTAQVWQAV